MKVFLTGGTGFVGGHIIRHLLEEGHEVTALIRPGSEPKLNVPPERINIIQGDLLDPESFISGMAGCDAVIHLVGIIREFPRKGITFEKMHINATENVVHGCSENDIKRFIFMSALGVRHDSASKYFTTKARAEDIVRSNHLDYTILKPSLIYGPGDEFINYFVNIIRTFHIIPVVGHGRYRMQPVYIGDVSQVFVQALTNEKSIGKSYEIGGPERYEYRDMMKMVKGAMGSWALTMKYPKFLMVGFAKLLQYFKFFPITEDQIIQLYDENITDDMRVYEDFDVQPTPFEEKIHNQLSKE